MTEWYYVHNRRQIGPLDEIAMRSLIRTAEITRETLVWHAAMSDWVPAFETELKTNFSESGTQNTEEPQHLIPAGAPVNFSAESLHTLWIWFACTIGSALPLYYICSKFLSETAAMGVIVSLAVTASIISYVLLYRFWSLIQSGSARTTPKKAVGFCFIPFYNIYWNYIAYVGLAADINRFCDERNITGPRVNEKIANIWYVVSILAIFPGTGGIFSVPLIVFQIMLVKQLVEVSKIIIALNENEKTGNSK